MITHYTATALTLLMVTSVFAQPNLPSGSSSFAPGENYLIHRGNYFTPPDLDQANTTWNHATFATTASTTAQFVAPSVGAPAGSTVSEVVGAGNYAHYKATATAFEQVGLTSPGASLNCTNGLTVYAYPFTYGTEVDDTYSCTGSTNGEAFTRTGTMDLHGGSWGTLVLPYGTFINVLMIESIQEHEDIVASDPDFPISYYARTQHFVKPGVKMPLLYNYEGYQLPGPYITFARLLDGSVVGMDEALRNAVGVDLIPNPATDHVDVVFGSAALGLAHIEVIDATGKVLAIRSNSNTANGMQREVLDITSLAAGIYSVRVTDGNGATGTKRLVKN